MSAGGMTRSHPATASLHPRQAPYGADEGAGGPESYVTTNQREFAERDLAQAHRAPVRAADLPARPLPYGIEVGADSLERFVTTHRAQYAPRDPRDGSIGRREAFDFKGRPVPYAFDVGHEKRGSYETTHQSQFQPQLFDLSQARVPISPQSNYFGRPLPYASQPETDGADRWQSSAQRHFVPRDLALARPTERLKHDAAYNLITLEPNPTFAPAVAEPRGRTAALGITRPVGVNPLPASRQTERHFVQWADTFCTNPLTAHAYTSAAQLREDVSKHTITQPPSSKHHQPVTEAHRVGWPQPTGERSPIKEAYHGRHVSFITKQQESLKLHGRTIFSGALQQNGPIRAII